MQGFVLHELLQHLNANLNALPHLLRLLLLLGLNRVGRVFRPR
jgi:hypothetical protein